ncbi:hypothetical protein HDU98_012021 [Podochytrium sp. JEL0797]|nr:hypothetical protein HDU98_012021 [Podochytrium sp. JEL0797]
MGRWVGCFEEHLFRVCSDHCGSNKQGAQSTHFGFRKRTQNGKSPESLALQHAPINTLHQSFLFTHSHAGSKVSHEHESHGTSGIFGNPLEASVLGESVKAVMVGAPVGAFYGASKAWWFKYPMGQGLGLVGAQGALIGGLAGIYVGANTLAAHAREKDDIWNASYAGLATGLAVGMRAGSLQKMIFFSAAFSGLALWGKFFSTDLKEKFHMSRFEKKQSVPPMFAGNQRDPYKERWEAIQAREAAAAE